MTKHLTTRKIALLGIFLAMALLMFVVENLLPPLILPGAKLGLSNIFVLLTVILLGNVEAIILVVAKCVLGSLIVGNLTALMYSLTAGLVSVTISIVLYKFIYPKISLICISVVSAVVHNLIQTIVFCLITNTPSYFMFIGYLALFGVLAGVITGLVVILLLKYVPTKVYDKFLSINKENQNP
ncbi:MAG: Gx transporter family protein [Clostridia bacterium]